MILKRVFLYPCILWCMSLSAYADGFFAIYGYRPANTEVQIPYDTDFLLPAGRLFSPPTRLIFPDMKTGDTIYIVIHDMQQYREGIRSENPLQDRFMIWTDSNNIVTYKDDGVLKTFGGGFDSGLPKMFRIPLFFPVETDRILEDRYPSHISRDISNTGLEYDYGEGPDDYIIGKKQVSFWVHKNISDSVGMTQISATLRAIGRNTDTDAVPRGEDGACAYIFVDDREWENGHVNVDVVREIADTFNGENGLYAEMTGLLGYEWGGGPFGDGGIDGNKNIYILLHDIQDGFSGAGGFVGGYYYAVNDIGTTPFYKVMGVHSNEKQMIVLDTYPSIAYKEKKNLAGSISILIHEFQHMIHFNQKDGRDGQWTSHGYFRSDIWLDEACSMLCEDIFKDYTADPEYFVYNERLPNYLMNPSWPLDYWPDNSRMDDALKSYATVYSFLAYLARNLSPLILTEIISGAGRDDAGLDAISSAVEALGENSDIETLIKRWREAIIYNDVTVPWHGYPYVSDEGYDLSELDLADILAAWGFSGAAPAFHNIPGRPAAEKISAGYTSRIYSGKIQADGDVRIYIKNGPRVSHLQYKVIKK